MGDTMIRIEGLTKSFPLGGDAAGRLQVLRGIDLTVERGRITAIVGASGAGKSTLLHIIGTLDRPTSGKVFVEGVDLFALGDEELARFRNRDLGFVFQFQHLLPEFTALENVAMPALITGKRMSEARGAALALLGEVGLEDKAESRPTKLSGGEQQRVAVARALMNNPRIILADEPSGNLDTANAKTLHDLLWDLSRRHGQTVVVVTHNELLAKRADVTLRMVDGLLKKR